MNDKYVTWVDIKKELYDELDPEELQEAKQRLAEFVDRYNRNIPDRNDTIDELTNEFGAIENPNRTNVDGSHYTYADHLVLADWKEDLKKILEDAWYYGYTAGFADDDRLTQHITKESS